MPRPTDWSVLGLSNDPTPGDAPRLERVIASQKELVELAGVVDDGLKNVRDTTDGAFVGKTADALREVIDNKLRKFVETFAEAHRNAGNALTTYHGVMVEEQRKADAALESARGLGDDDEAEAERSRLRGEAEEAGNRQREAGDEAARVLRSAASSISSPVDACEEIWKALQWLAIILIIPAILVGGPLALFTIALNAAILIKTAIDFSQGKAGVADLVFAILGIIAPSTRALNVGKVWAGLRGGFSTTKDFFKLGPNVFTSLRLSGAFGGGTRVTTLWLRNASGIMTPVRINAPVLGGIQASVLRGVGLAGYTAIRMGVGLVRFTPGAFRAGVHGITKFRFISFFLPVAREEMRFGMGLAFRIGFIDRGLFGKHIYGFSPTVTAGIRGGAGAASGIGSGVMVLSRPGGAGFGAGGFGVPTPGMGGMGGFTAPNISAVGAGVADLRVMPPIGVPVRPGGISPGGPAGPVVPSIVTPGSLTPPGGLSGIGGLGPGGLAPGGLGSVNLGQISLSPLSVLRTPMGGIDMPPMSARIADLPSIGTVQPPQLGSMSSMTGMGGITIGSPGSVNLGALAPTPAPVAVNNAVTAPTVTAPSVSAPQLGSIAAPAPVSPGAVSLGAVNPGTVSPGGLNPGSVSLGGVNAGGINPGGLNPGGLNPGTVSLGGVNAGAINTAGLNVGGLNAGGMSLGGINPGNLNPAGLNVGGLNAGGMSLGGINPGGLTPGGVSVGGVSVGGVNAGVPGSGVTAPGAGAPNLGAPGTVGHIPASLSGVSALPTPQIQGIQGITSLGGITPPGQVGVSVPGSVAGAGSSSAPTQHLLNVPSLSQTSLGQTPALPSITARIVDLPGTGLGGSPTSLGSITAAGAVSPGNLAPPPGAVISPGSVPTPGALTPGTLTPGTVTPGTVTPGTVTPPPAHAPGGLSNMAPAPAVPSLGTVTPGGAGSAIGPVRAEAGLQAPSVDGRIADLPGTGLGNSSATPGPVTAAGAVSPGNLTPPPGGVFGPDGISVANIPTPQLNGVASPGSLGAGGTITPATVTPGAVTPGTITPATITPGAVTPGTLPNGSISPAPAPAPAPGAAGSSVGPVRAEGGLQAPSVDGRIADLPAPRSAEPVAIGAPGSPGGVSGSLPAPTGNTLPEGYVNPAHIPVVSTTGTAPLPPAGVRPEGTAAVSSAAPAPVAPRPETPTAHAPVTPRPETPVAHTPVAPRPAADGVAPPGPPARLDDPPSALVPRGEGAPDDLALSPPPKSSGDKDAVNALAALNRLFGHDPAWHRLLMQRMGIDQGVQVFMMRGAVPTPASGTPAIQPFDFTVPGGTGSRVTFDGTTPTVTQGTNGREVRVEVGTGGNPVVRITEDLGPNATRQWTIAPDGNPIGTGVQRVTLNDGGATPTQITLRLDGSGAPERVTHAGGGGVTTGNVSLLPGGTELRITDPATNNFTLHTTTGDLRYSATSLQPHSPTGGPAHPLANHYLTTTPGGDVGLLRAGPDPDHPGVTVFGAVDGATVTPQTGAVDLRVAGTGTGTGDALRVRHGDHDLIVAPNGTHTHDVTALHGLDGRPIPHVHLFTTTSASGAAPGTVSLRTDLGAPAPNAAQLPTGHWHVTDTTTGDFTLHTTGGDLDYHALSLRNPDGGPAHPLANHYLTTTPDGNLGLIRTDGAPVPTLTPQPGTIAPQTAMGPGVTRIDAGGHHLVVDGNGRHIHDAITLRDANGAPTGTHLFTPPNAAGTVTTAIARSDLGAPVPNTTVTRVDGHWHVTDTTTGDFTRHTDTGALEYR
ncbi:hypothetical protein LZF96_25955, partial [Streptomyces sp. ST2-7A]|nr:hypothetical protein [Streptomyces sp. ST2-7A]